MWFQNFKFFLKTYKNLTMEASLRIFFSHFWKLDQYSACILLSELQTILMKDGWLKSNWMKLLIGDLRYICKDITLWQYYSYIYKKRNVRWILKIKKIIHRNTQKFFWKGKNFNIPSGIQTHDLQIRSERSNLLR